jgi:3-oxoacyl-[acyl-carrier-protein] synthase II
MVALNTTRARVAIVAGARTPFVKMGGALREVHVADLTKAALQETLYRAGWASERLDEVILGNVVMPADAANIARVSALYAGVPKEVPGLSVQRNCASGMEAVAEAALRIRGGQGKVMLAGGAESAITPLTVAGFANAKALSRRNDDPARASRPFDRDRDGFVLGEGAGVLVLEELERAQRRGARIYAEIVGYAMTSDAYHITSPPDDGEGAVRCMNLALKDAALAKQDVGYINAHATSTFADQVETQAIKQVFGEHAHRIPVSSTKSMTGHLLGAAGGIEAAFSVLAIHRSMLPPTINLDHPDPSCDLDYVPHRARNASVGVALSNSFGFGGVNACVVFKRLAS